jgi:glycosidase
MENKFPNLYEINTRVWIKRFATVENPKPKLTDIPDSYWVELAKKNINIIWLMGVWNVNKEAVKKYCFEDFLKRNYDKALRDWKEEDIIGSPYAIEEYSINPELGDNETIPVLRKKLNSLGMKLFLDFIPNHFSAASKLLVTNSEIFLQADEDVYDRDQYTFFKHEENGKVFAHGRDPFFPAWQDTAQINYISPDAIVYMIDSLLRIAECCDGVRCDMAMLALSNVFYNTWRGVLNKAGFSKPEREFWQVAIKRVKQKFPEFLFIAETYWDLEWDLQQLGFDFTYDKRLTDRLKLGNIYDVKSHLSAEIVFQEKLVRFIENHDEERAAFALGKNKNKAAAIIMSTLPGMHLFHDGQFEGKKIKLPVQLGREPFEKTDECLPDFYNKLLDITSAQIFISGEWKLIEPLKVWDNNYTNERMLCWLWSYKIERRLVVVNYSDSKAQCRVKLDLRSYPENFELFDLLNNFSYIRSRDEVNRVGLFIELQPYQSHIFGF